MQLFFTPNIDNSNYILSDEESRHCIKVLRKKEGDLIDLVDGNGFFYKAEIINPHHKKCEVKVVEKIAEVFHRDYKLHIAIAPTKNNDRFEWFLEKVTEIGIDEITPLLCEHSERKIIKVDRLNKRIISAMKQSLKATLPKLNQMQKYSDFLNQNFTGSIFIAHCNIDNLPHLIKTCKPKQDVIILIGPEGDFSVEEVALAKNKNFIEIGLGKSRLRTETAAVFACATVNLLNE